MLRGFYAAASGMITQQRRQEMLTNNLANANTPGFKEDTASTRAFPEMLLSRLGGGGELSNGKRLMGQRKIGDLNTGVYMQEGIVSFKSGTLQSTGNKTDIALTEVTVPENGALFFEVLNANGESRYTRNGNFTLDQNGFLTTNEGFYVSDTEGNQIQIEGTNFTVSETGIVMQDGQEIAQLNIAFSQNRNDLVKEGTGLFALDGGGVLPSAIDNDQVDFKLNQGFLEGSNVDVQRTMTEMMMAYRNFEANQKVLKAYDQSMEKAVNEIGRLR